jgi:hypothetical protein
MHLVSDLILADTHQLIVIGVVLVIDIGADHPVGVDIDIATVFKVGISPVVPQYTAALYGINPSRRLENFRPIKLDIHAVTLVPIDFGGYGILAECHRITSMGGVGVIR